MSYKYVLMENIMSHEYGEKFKGEDLIFQPGEKKKMTRNDAVNFLGQSVDGRVKNFRVTPILDNDEEGKEPVKRARKDIKDVNIDSMKQKILQ